MKKILTPLTLTTIFVLSLLVGSMAIYIVHTSKSSAVLQYVNTGFRRVVIIENIDIAKGVIGVRTSSRTIASHTNLVLTIDERTNVHQQEPIITNGVITSFTPVEEIDIRTLIPEVEAMIQIQVLGDGRLRAGSILLRSPFVKN